jgi:hypothetical protein
VIEWQARRDNERMRPMPRRALYPAACLPILLLLGACAAAWPERPPLTLDQQRAAVVPDMPDVRFWSDETPAEMTKIRSRLTRERRGTATEGLPLTLLALSSGSDNAAYAAGVLEGWTRSGTRPDFTVVTGVSAGALTAPFAFLGSDHDARLRRLYTTITQKDVFARRGVSGLVSGPSLVDTRPLRTLIAANIDAALVDRIAAQHKRGRRLYIMTTNLDAGRGVVWDMGAIAASGSPRRLDLFRDILLASASVPGAFTPVLIPAQSGGQSFSELHVDGATISGFYVVPDAALWTGGGAQPGGAIYLIVNGKLAPDFEVVKPRSFSILGRALMTVLYSQDRLSIIGTYNYARQHGMNFHMTYIGDDFGEKSKSLFAQPYMSNLYEYGVRKGASKSSWLTQPPQPESTP